MIREKVLGWLVGQKGDWLSTIMALTGVGSAQWSQWNYAAYAAEGYGGNPYVYRAVKLVADATSSMEVYAREQTTTEEGQRTTVAVGDDHPMQRAIAKPNGYQSWEQFLGELVVNVYMAGEAFVLLPETRGALFFNSLDPSRMVVKEGAKRGEVAAYEYGFGADRQVIDPELVVHIKLYNPLDQMRGMSPLSPAAKSIDLNNAARSFHKALLDNGAVPGLAIKSAKNANQQSVDAIKAQLLARKGASRAGESLVLGATEDVKPVGWSPKDLAWTDGSTMSLREIAVAIGVAPELIGDSANKTYSNYQEARQALYIETVVPLLKLILSALSARLQERYPGVEYAIDLDSIDALKESQDALWNRVTAGFQGGLISLNMALDQLGFDRVTDEDGEPEPWADQRALMSGGAVVLLEDALSGEASFGAEDETGETKEVVEPVAQPVAAGAIPAEPAANTALTGIQVQSAAEIVAQVASRKLPRASGVAMLITFFNLSSEQAEGIMGEVGVTFFAESAPPVEEFIPGKELSLNDTTVERMEKMLDDGDVEGAFSVALASAKARNPIRERLADDALPLIERVLRKIVESYKKQALKAFSEAQ